MNAIIHAHHDDLSPSTTQSKNMQATTTVTFSITSSLMKTPNFRHFFDQLEFTKELIKEAAISLVQIVREQYGECNLVEWSMGKMATGYENAID